MSLKMGGVVPRRGDKVLRILAKDHSCFQANSAPAGNISLHQQLWPRGPSFSTFHGLLPSQPPRTAATMQDSPVATRVLSHGVSNNMIARIWSSLKPYTPFFARPVQAVKPEPPSPKHRMPTDAWDSHMHVIDDKFPFAPEAVYTPNTHTLNDAMTFESSVGINNIVLVQPSIYGHDNSCLLDALQNLGPRRARGVISFDPDTTPRKQLQQWHELGVRGVRLNLCSNGRAMPFEELETLLRKYADAVRPLNWAVQVYIPMALIEPLESIVPSLNIRFCIDHLGHPSLKDFGSASPYDLPGFGSLARLLKNGHVFVKLSAPYRLSQVNDQSDIEPVAKEIIRLGGKRRVVFATDWPHTRFEGLDIRPWIEKVMDWCDDDDVLIERLFRGNAEDLWSVTRNE